MEAGDDMNVKIGFGTISGTLSGFAIGIGFSVGVCMVTLTIIFAWYFCGCKTHRINETHDPPANSATEIKKGLDEATLHEYPKMLYSNLEASKFKRDCHDENDEDVSFDSCCPICLVEYIGSDFVRLLPSCKHVFHQKCIDPWFRLHASCPMCRKSPLKSQLLETPLDDQPNDAVERV